MNALRRIDLHAPSTWSPALVATMAVAIIALIVGLSHWLFVADIAHQIERTKSQISEQKQLYQSNQQTLSKLPTIRREIDALEQTREALRAHLPTDLSMPLLLDNVYQVARDNHMVFSRLKPEANIDSHYYSIKPIRLQAQSGFIDSVAFIDAVSRLSRIVSVQNVSFSAEKNYQGEPNHALKTTIELRTYLLKTPPQPVPATIAQGEMPDVKPLALRVEKGEILALTDPFRRRDFAQPLVAVARPDEEKPCLPAACQPPTTHEKQVLENYDLSALKFVGTLMGRAQVALIKTPDSGVVSVGVGDYLGRDAGRVQTITPTRITLDESVYKNGGWQQRRTELIMKK